MSSNYSTNERLSGFDLIRRQWRVLHALMLRDIKTRFFGKAWGFLLSLGWPLSHIMTIVLMNTFAGRLQPFGDSIVLWAASGTVPYIAFLYMARFIMLGIVANRPLLIFPVVKLMDIVIARAIVEVLSAGAVIMIVSTIFYVIGVDFMPPRPLVAFYGLAAAFLLGLGAGVINAIIASVMPLWAVIFNLMAIVFWVISGVVFVPDNLPQKYLAILSYNPVMHCVAWFRSAYYDGYGDLYLDKHYVLMFGATALFLGLSVERLLRGRILQR